MKHLIILTIIIFSFISIASAQTDGAKLNSTSDGDKGEATIYVYRNSYHHTFGKEAPTITVNDEKLAVLDVGRYFMAHVPTGFIIIRSGKKKDNQVEIEARPGEIYYMRVRAHPGQLFARFELFRVTKEEAQADAPKLSYVKAGDIKSDRVLKNTPKLQ